MPPVNALSLSRFTRGAAAVLGVALIVGVVVAVALTRGGSYRITADFAEAPGLYVGNKVSILGVPVGRVTSIDAQGKGVTLELEIDEKYRLPDDAAAFLMAPNAVNDRYIELTPAYPGAGPRLDEGAEIPRTRTNLPASVDQIIDSVDELSTALGPEGVNADGSLSGLFARLAELFGGKGSDINGTIDSLGQVFGALTDDTDDITSGLQDLGDLTTEMSSVSEAYRSLTGDLAVVGEQVAEDAPQITATLSSLNDVLGELNEFVRRNHSQLEGTVTDLSAVASEVGDQQKALTQLLRSAPLAVDNVGEAIEKGDDGKLLLASRLNPVKGAPVGQQICGDGLLRMMLVALTKELAEREVMDLSCGIDRWYDEELGKPKGAPDASSWTRQALSGLGGGR